MPQRRQIGDQPFGKGRHDQPVVIHQARVTQAGGNLPRQVEFRRAAEPHAGRTVQEQMDVAVRLAFEQLDVQLVPPRVQRPVDGVKIVAGRIVAMTGDLSSAAGQLLSRRGQERTAAGPLRRRARAVPFASAVRGKKGHGTRKDERQKDVTKGIWAKGK